MKIYYARPLTMYGTKQEARDLELLKALGFEVNDPNKSELQERYKTEGMEVFLQLARESDAVAFRAFQDGKIGAGVCGEVDEEIRMGKPVFELPTLTQNRRLSVEATREYLTYLGQR